MPTIFTCSARMVTLYFFLIVDDFLFVSSFVSRIVFFPFLPQINNITYAFRALSGHFYPKQITISTFVERVRQEQQYWISLFSLK